MVPPYSEYKIFNLDKMNYDFFFLGLDIFFFNSSFSYSERFVSKIFKESLAILFHVKIPKLKLFKIKQTMLNLVETDFYLKNPD